MIPQRPRPKPHLRFDPMNYDSLPLRYAQPARTGQLDRGALPAIILGLILIASWVFFCYTYDKALDSGRQYRQRSESLLQTVKDSAAALKEAMDRGTYTDFDPIVAMDAVIVRDHPENQEAAKALAEAVLKQLDLKTTKDPDS